MRAIRSDGCPALERLDGESTRPMVVVVGAGVSGCACGATLAAAGVPVTLVNNALDSVGLPSFGPEICVGGGCAEQVLRVLDELPACLREAWVRSCVVPVGSEDAVVVDRRLLSLETKRALESLGDLSFRQGLVVDVQVPGGNETLSAPSRAPREKRLRPVLGAITAFGETIEGDGLVLAPGLSLGGTVVVGRQTLMGGRYGETPSRGLYEVLCALGFAWEAQSLEVGPRVGTSYLSGERREEDFAGGSVGGCAGGSQEWVGARLLAGTNGRRPCSAGGAVARGCEGPLESDHSWGEGAPPSPYACGTVELGRFERAGSGSGCADTALWLTYPDGMVTGERYVVESGGSLSMGAGRCIESRLGQTISGLSVVNTDSEGRCLASGLNGTAVWVSGRAAGAAGYLGSLRSGVAVARAVHKELCGGPLPTEATTVGLRERGR